MDVRSAADAINNVDANGMSQLHIAIGFNDLDQVRALVIAGAKFFPDNEGRWPSLIAAICETSEEMQDYVAEQERKAEAGSMT
jgi:ankyrin repeat protein